MSHFDFGIPGLTPPDPNAPRDRAKILIHGPQGSGKTLLASTIAQCGRTVFVDLLGEHGTLSFQGTPWEKNIQIERPNSVSLLDDLYQKLAYGDHPFDAVIIDSATSVGQMGMRYLQGHSETAMREIRKGGTPPSFGIWGQNNSLLHDLATFWYDLSSAGRKRPMHVVMTAQTKVNDNEVSGTRDRVPDIQKGATSMFLAAPDYILYTDVEENPEALADENAPPAHHIVRFGAHPGYSTKARVPQNLRGKIPPVLGRPNPKDGTIRQPNLTTLMRLLGVGGVPPLAAKKASAAAPAPAPTAPTAPSKENN